MRWAVPSILVSLGLWGWGFGGIAGFTDAAIPINQVTHNTLWVTGHFHTYYLLGGLAFAFAYMYHVIAERSGKRENALSRGAAWLYGLGGAGFVLMFLLSGALSMPRRYAEHISAWQMPDWVSVVLVGLIALSLLWLGGEIFLRLGRALRIGNRTAGLDRHERRCLLSGALIRQPCSSRSVRLLFVREDILRMPVARPIGGASWPSVWRPSQSFWLWPRLSSH